MQFNPTTDYLGEKNPFSKQFVRTSYSLRAGMFKTIN
jgi:hypothetical protein